MISLTDQNKKTNEWFFRNIGDNWKDDQPQNRHNEKQDCNVSSYLKPKMWESTEFRRVGPCNVQLDTVKSNTGREVHIDNPSSSGEFPYKKISNFHNHGFEAVPTRDSESFTSTIAASPHISTSNSQIHPLRTHYSSTVIDGRGSVSIDEFKICENPSNNYIGQDAFYGRSRIWWKEVNHSQSSMTNQNDQKHMEQVVTQVENRSENDEEWNPEQNRDDVIPIVDTRTCSNCKLFTLYVCKGCQRVRFCSIECQINAWDEHKAKCVSYKSKPVTHGRRNYLQDSATFVPAKKSYFQNFDCSSTN